MAKPTLKPQWQSLYNPMANEVWAAILATTFLMCVALVMVRCELMLTPYGEYLYDPLVQVLRYAISILILHLLMSVFALYGVYHSTL